MELPKTTWTKRKFWIKSLSPHRTLTNSQFNGEDIATLEKLTETNGWLMNKILSKEEKDLHFRDYRNFQLPNILKKKHRKPWQKMSFLDNIHDADFSKLAKISSMLNDRVYMVTKKKVMEARNAKYFGLRALHKINHKLRQRALSPQPQQRNLKQKPLKIKFKSLNDAEYKLQNEGRNWEKEMKTEYSNHTQFGEHEGRDYYKHKIFEIGVSLYARVAKTQN